MGFFAKGVDGRIDDSNAGWKGRGLWVTSGNRTPMHIEASMHRVRALPARPPRARWSCSFQLRPDPLAHEMGAPKMAPIPRRSSRPGEARGRLDLPAFRRCHPRSYAEGEAGG